MVITIDMDVPVPQVDHSRGTPYPWKTLQLGQSFFAPVSQVSSTNWSHKTGFKYTIRSVEEGGVKGVRVWRIA
jgi:hypothetical protein